jgi:hypothetical protein
VMRKLKVEVASLVGDADVTARDVALAAPLVRAVFDLVANLPLDGLQTWQVPIEKLWRLDRLPFV